MAPKQGLHGVGVVLRYGNDLSRLAACLPLVVEHATGLQAEVEAFQGVASGIRVTPPEYGFDIMLKEHGLRQRWEVRRRHQKVANLDVKTFTAHELQDGGFHLRGIEPADRKRHFRNQTRSQFQEEPE